MAWRGAASRTVLAAVRRPGPSPSAAARALRAPPPVAAPRPRRVPSPFASSSPTAARPLAAMMGSPLTTAALLARLTAHPAASARACCELSQGISFRRTCQDR
ncbi:translation initiation factor IF-2 isoform X1 [Oryza sativa Japonica Group]|uniref:Uncharacterized protein n=3 Tax=Oryza TaxID=4527 RepID=A0A0E0GW01_ORYNI|nr:uncharacterized protein LOC4352680 isoform X1 [Oryza sativa Japonica Group]XP_015618717.1 uncharacterized protein LOC4352680 isoform X1 [Oryza sativa Japonica Group]XP_052137863.1 uncharacterized protein LOC127756554 isoform X1 [Oryza glaberrima]XP_052137864.1 uncharacterized protein LOC127756554 isoform X1 [Oryza glaberrima]KAF2908618.1 hypothetical protein DAI22_12g195900 [Oryza sativa Japonica Group]KAF2908619.1 hypothetical protein DAI22_12g195900 [Oryza sativa Japonica Group]KAF290862